MFRSLAVAFLLSVCDAKYEIAIHRPVPKIPYVPKVVGEALYKHNRILFNKAFTALST